MKKNLIVLILLAAFCSLAFAAGSTAEYTAWKAAQAPKKANSLDYADRLCNSLVCVQIGTDGLFNIGTADGRSLLYVYPADPWSSHIIVQVDGLNYELGGAGMCDGTATFVNWSDDGTSITENYTLLDYLNIQVIHTPVIFSSTTGAILTRTIVTNNDPTGATHNIGVMYEYDTTVDGDDFAQLYLGPNYVTTETCYDAPFAYPYWDAVPASGSLVGRGTFTGGAAVTPDHMAFGSWPHFVGVCWDVQCSGSPYGDSAVLYKWDPQPVGPNSTRNVATYYGVGEIVQTPGVLAIGVVPPGLECTDNGIQPNPFQVVVNVENTGGETCTQISVQLTDGAGPGGSAVVTSTNPVIIPSLDPGANQTVTFTLSGTFNAAGGCINATANVTSQTCESNSSPFCITVPQCEVGCPFPYEQVDMGNLGECYPTKVNNPAHGLSGVAWIGPCITGETEPPLSSERDCFGNRDLPPLDPCTDGVAFFGIPWQPCSYVTVAVMITGGPHYGAYAECGGHLYLNAWQDGNINGNFDDQNSCGDGTTNEWIVQDALVTPGLHLYTFKNPFDANLSRPVVGIFRFRLNSHPVGRYGYGQNVVDPHCPAVLGDNALDFLGEVEDYILCDFMLDVQMASFTATAGDNAVNMSWRTASETQNDHFEIVRDGATIAQIPSKGNNSTEQNYSYTDDRAVNGTTYNYALVAVDISGGRHELRTATVTPAAGAGSVTEYALSQNFPNPFNPTTAIRFDLVEQSNVTLKVFNMVGQEVATLVNGSMNAGRHVVSFDATNLPSGLYIYRIEANGFEATKKMLLMK